MDLLDNAPGLDLSPLAIGDCLVRMFVTSVALGHSRLAGSFVYMHPEPGSEAEFVMDVMSLPNEEVANKWFGGTEGVRDLHQGMQIAENVFSPDASS